MIKTYLITLSTFLLLDFIWLSSMVSRLYKPNIGHLMATSPNFIAAGVFYIFYIAGLLFLAIYQSAHAQEAFIKGAVFGLMTYGTYGFTNMATLKDWPLHMTLIDCCWGTLLCGLCAYVGYSLQ